MKVIQIIDGADNCNYPLYGICDEDFHRIFCMPGQDIEFITDFIDRVGEDEALRIMEKTWKQKLDKTAVSGIHGTLFYELDYKKKFYPNKRELDIEIQDTHFSNGGTARSLDTL